METILLRYVSLSLGCFSALFLILILVSCLLENRKTVLLKIYICMAASCVAALLFEAVSYLASFFQYPGTETLRLVSSTTAVLWGYSLSFFYTCYVANLVGLERRLCRLSIKFLKVTGVIAVCSLITGSYFKLFFTYPGGLFIPGKYFVGIFAFDILACLTGIFLIVHHGKKLNRKDIVALLSLPILIFVAAVLQYTRLGLMFGLFQMAAVSLFIIYLMIQTDRNKRIIEQEKQLMDMNITVMLSQIQPHFLYNALSSIRRMIKKDPEVAVVAVENFSLYLRQNLESMNRVEPISFATELRHVEEYLYLEKLRFGQRLQVEYDIAYHEFTLPVLTLQPIVENAVNHGILKKEEGGRVKISTRKQNNTVILCVEDDGVGFCPSAQNTSGRTHIGLKNVENRIRMQSQGTLHIESKVGEGTAVTITLPLI